MYEKNEEVGGVWFLNKYPGLACDIPCKLVNFHNIAKNEGTDSGIAHSYQYSFAPNPHWTRMYAPGKEIQQYLKDVADRFGATRFIKTSQKVERAEWLADEKKWKLDVKNVATGETFEDKADIFITARGQLNECNWPDLPGLDKFQGKLLHSGDWDDK